MKILVLLIQFFGTIPASFWGVVVGSIFSIGGVALTNRAGDRRLRSQLEHEREMRIKDREMALRKEIYLDAAEAIAAGLNAISRFPNLDIPHDQLTHSYIEKSPSISKVHVIAQAETVEPLSGFMGQLSSLFLELFAERAELQKSKSAITLIDSQVAELGKERDRILERIRQHNIEGVVDDRRWDVLQKAFEFEQKRIFEQLAHREQIANVLYPRQLEFMRECVAHSAKLNRLLIPVLAAVRRELELPLDEDAYRKVAEVSLANQQAAVDHFVQRLMPAAQPGNEQVMAQ